jgi:hypothetical protein
MQTIITELSKAEQAKSIEEIREIMDSVYDYSESMRFHPEITKSVRIAHRASQLETAERCKIHIRSAMMMYHAVIIDQSK